MNEERQFQHGPGTAELFEKTQLMKRYSEPEEEFSENHIFIEAQRIPERQKYLSTAEVFLYKVWIKQNPTSMADAKVTKDASNQELADAQLRASIYDSLLFTKSPDKAYQIFQRRFKFKDRTMRSYNSIPRECAISIANDYLEKYGANFRYVCNWNNFVFKAPFSSEE